MEKAVSIALLLPPWLRDICVSLNQSMPNNSYIRFSDWWPMPHISLNQTVLNDSEIESVKEFLSTYQQKSFELYNIRINNITRSTWSKTCYIEFDSQQIQTFHEELMNFCWSFEKRIAKTGHHLFWEDVSDSQLQYITNFRTDHAYGNFNPHITLGKGHFFNSSMYFDTQFKCSEIWIFHLGPNGTCQVRL